MPKPCHERHPIRAPGCRLCELWDTEPRYRALWGGDPAAARLGRPAGGPGVRPALQRLRLDCVHLGGVVEHCTSCGAEARHVRDCAHPENPTETCTLAHPRSALWRCADCPHYRRRSPPLEWVSTARLARDAALLGGLLPPDCSAVAGVPRSGLIPAALIAAQLHVPLWQLTEEGRLERLGHGSRGRATGFAASPQGGPIAVIDDTVYGGGAMRRARQALRGRRAVYAAVYVRPEAAGAVDVYARLLPSPHLLEWNLANNGPMAGFAANPIYGAGLAWDIDGVIVHDHASGGRPGTPYLVPRLHPCRLIVTGRRQRHRAETERMLAGLGVRWERLELYADGAPETAEGIARHKAAHYAASRCGFFVESDPAQAEWIFRLADKPVICPAAAKVWG